MVYPIDGSLPNAAIHISIPYSIIVDHHLDSYELPNKIVVNPFSNEVTAHYPPSLYFNIDYMWLSIEPDFNTKRIACKQQLKITTLQNLEMVELDCSFNDTHKIEIESIYYSYSASEGDARKLNYRQSNDKLSIELGEKLPEGSKFYLIITYTAKGSKPPDGFVFVEVSGKRHSSGLDPRRDNSIKEMVPMFGSSPSQIPKTNIGDSSI